MNSPVKILYFENRMGSLNSDWFRDIVCGVFEFEAYVPGQSYVPGTLFYANCIATTPAELEYLHSREFRILYDNLWELYSPPAIPAHVIHTVNWFWYNESLWYKHLGYNQYSPNKTYEKTALMPIRRSKLHRDFLIKELTPVLNDLIWSYIDRGQQLPDDGDMNDWNTQRYFNPTWYDRTYFSIVVESEVESAPLHPIFITEKTFKPIAFQHPFIVYGNTGTLATLHNLGFATFENLFDETYDTVVNSKLRAGNIVQQIKDFKLEPYSTETQQKLAHNHAHFFNTELVKQRIRTEIVEPILNYAETR